MRQKITLITLGVSDFSKSMEFYEKCLKWKKSTASMDDMVLFPLGGIVLGIHPLDLLAADTGVSSERSSFSGITLALNTTSEKEVNDILNEVSNWGGSILKPAEKAFWGGYHGFFKDPDGYVFEVAYNPFWKLDENENLDLP